MKDEDFKLLGGFALRLTDKRTDICDCRVAFATEKVTHFLFGCASNIYCLTHSLPDRKSKLPLLSLDLIYVFLH